MRVDDLTDLLRTDNPRLIRQVIREVNESGPSMTMPENPDHGRTIRLLFSAGTGSGAAVDASLDRDFDDAETTTLDGGRIWTVMSLLTGLVLVAGGGASSRVQFVAGIVRKLGGGKLAEWTQSIRSALSEFSQDPSLRQGFP